jgi:glucosylceramidase
MNVAKSGMAAWLSAVLLALGGCASVPGGTAAPVAVQWSSSADGTRKLARQPDLALTMQAAAAQAAETTITIDPAQRFQRIVGFGAGMTDASAELIMALPEDRRAALLDDLFSRQGLNLSFLRLPIGASDFSREHYSFDDMPAGGSDPALAQFSMARAAPQLAATKAAQAHHPGLALMASPWSAPGWMKTSDSLITGRLAPQHFADFAAYLDRYLAEMQRQGVGIAYLTIQNEPHFEPKDYPGMRVDPAARAAFVGQHLGPLLARHHRPTRILDWDHNWNEPESPLAVLRDPAASRYIAGVAWHCYGGDVSAQAQVAAAYPGKEVFFTECSGGAWAPDWGGTLGWMTDKLIIGSSRTGSRGTLLWNLALDERSGPHKGGCGDCRGVVTIDSRSGAVTRNVEYYVLGHAARFVQRGARRIASTSADAGAGAITHVAFANPDRSLVLIAHNPGTAAAMLRVQAGSRGFAVSLPPGEVATFVWPQKR